MTYDDQAEFFIEMLARRDVCEPGSSLYKAVEDWLRLPMELSEEMRAKVLHTVCRKTGMDPETVLECIDKTRPKKIDQTNGQAGVRELLAAKAEVARKEEAELLDLIPPSGFFRDYADYNACNEAPLAYHLWCGIAAFAATVNRKAWIGMGNHRLYPPFGIFLLGDSGMKKTTSGDIAVSLLRELSTVPIYAEKLTPEALIDGMQTNATGLVYAPEMTVLISKQKYMESIIPLLTRFMDCPDIWDSGTIMRGKAKLKNVAITCIMCTTIDWFIKNTPEALFGGGFIARNVMILQEGSARVWPRPPEERLDLRKRLVIALANASGLQGVCTLSPEAAEMYDVWYMHNKTSRMAESDLFETYFSRKHAHLLRVAMCLHMGTHDDLEVCTDCLDRALKILEWNERHFNLLHGKMFRTGYGEDQAQILRLLAQAGGNLTYVQLCRAMSYKMSSKQVASVLGSLKDQGLVREHMTSVSHHYELVRRDG